MVLFLTLLLALVGLLTLAGGIWLIVLGGSWYYLIVGVAFLLTAILLRRRHPASLFMFALVVAGVTLRTFVEVVEQRPQLRPQEVPGRDLADRHP